VKRPYNSRTANLGSGRHGGRVRECKCGRRITVGGPWEQHTRRCEDAQQYESERQAARILRDLGLLDREGTA
jgi:hypothetical protein